MVLELVEKGPELDLGSCSRICLRFQQTRPARAFRREHSNGLGVPAQLVFIKLFVRFGDHRLLEDLQDAWVHLWEVWPRTSFLAAVKSLVKSFNFIRVYQAWI